MEPRDVARLHALGRIAVGAALTAAPERSGRAWVGELGRRPGAGVLTTGLGARDLAIGAGTATALRRGYGASPWLRAGVLADAADLVATLRARHHLPPLAVAGVGLVAAGSVVLGLWVQSAVD
jgi:hypothetical protein